MEQDTKPDRISVFEAAKRARVSVRTIRRVIKNGLLETHQIAPHYPHRIDPAEVDRCFHLSND